MKTITINGSFTTHEFGGQERYAYELLSALDLIIKKEEFEIVIPNYVNNERIPKLMNIKIIFWK